MGRNQNMLYGTMPLPYLAKTFLSLSFLIYLFSNKECFAFQL